MTDSRRFVGRSVRSCFPQRPQGLLPGAKLAWSGAAGNKPCPLGVWMFEWTNRQPQAKITEIRFRTGNTRTIPALIAITGESAEAK